MPKNIPFRFQLCPETAPMLTRLSETCGDDKATVLRRLIREAHAKLPPVKAPRPAPRSTDPYVPPRAPAPLNFDPPQF